MDRLERLINLVAALLAAERPLSRQELRVRVGGYADEDEAFRRNFERDKDLLRQMGIPLAVDPLDPSRPEVGDGYRIPPDRYALADPGLADDELAALRLAASAVVLQGGEDAATTALRKLAGVPGSGRGDHPAPAGGATAGGATAAGATAGGATADAAAGAVAQLPADETVAVLFSAVAERRRVTFAYRSEGREVDPWRLSFRNGQWYLLGLDHGRAGPRLYRVDRIEGRPDVVSAAGQFTPPADVTVELPPAWQLGDEEELTAMLLVDADQARWAEAAAGPGSVVERRADGSAVLGLKVTNPTGFRSFALGFLEHAEVLGPPELRSDVVSWLEAIEAGATG